MVLVNLTPYNFTYDVTFTFTCMFMLYEYVSCIELSNMHLKFTSILIITHHLSIYLTRYNYSCYITCKQHSNAPSLKKMQKDLRNILENKLNKIYFMNE